MPVKMAYGGLVDLAIQTGQRVAEMARLKVGDFDERCQAMKAWRLKRHLSFAGDHRCE